MQQNGTDLAGEGGVEEQLFTLLDQYPIAIIASIIVMILVAIFFVSGADAASIVMGSLSQNGTIHPSRGTVIFWGVATGAGGCGDAPGGRRGRPQRPADDHDHRGVAVPCW
ncbi:MAG: BCCT family transporter [Mycobacterium kyogaense]